MELKLGNYVLTKSYEDACVDKVILKEKKQREQILYGSITKTILMICLPLAIYALFNSFYNLIDAMMASKIKDAASASGAIKQSDNANSQDNTGNGNIGNNGEFDASSSNSVYGAADEIRPVNYAVNIFIKY